MNKCCEITYNGYPVGNAKIEQTGLYYCFNCQCTLPKNGLYRLYAENAGQKKSIGICTWSGEAFGLVTKIPTKYIDIDGLHVYAVNENVQKGEDCKVVDKPLVSIEDIDYAYLLRVDGELHICIKSQAQVPQGSDQSPKSRNGYVHQ